MGNDDQSEGVEDLEQQLDQLREQVSVNRGDIDALQVASEESLDRADSSEGLAKEDRQRIDILEHRVDVDHELILELQADGLVQEEMAAHLQLALRTSRLIGAAIGIVMASCKVSDDAAFEILRTASQNTNQKLRVLADEVVATGDVSGLPAVTRRR
ncbi:ANTAR domain-containing protein [Humibacillus xanthopallidus]|uniref:ANTAR domain-containing protein n=1 Tax=Humibacillus xanthopallidus TaxID=412689 RepID=UPI00384FEDE4